MKEIKWNGHSLRYNPNDLIPLLAKVAQMTREQDDQCEKGFDDGYSAGVCDEW